MRWFKKEDKTAQFETVLQRLIGAQQGTLGFVNPENCMKSPTIHAIVTAISRRISITPIHVYESSNQDGLETKRKLPDHPVAKLLNQPNDWQSRVDYWLDATSSYVRYGKYIAVIGRGTTGPIRKLFPISAGKTEIKQDMDNLSVVFKYANREYPFSQIHYVRGPARDFLKGDSPVDDVRIAIALEIAAEEYGATFFSNGAIPLLIFKYIQGMKGFKDPNDEKKFIEDFQTAFSGHKRHRALLLPPGLERDQVNMENDKAQFLETRKLQRTIIAGAFGVPPHLVGDLERGTFNNVEQQDKDFSLNVIMPVVVAFEASMERDLLTQADRDSGIKIRFNIDSILRASFKERQEGLQIQLTNSVINPDEWREHEGMNPRPDGKGGEYYHSANYIKDSDNADTNPPV